MESPRILRLLLLVCVGLLPTVAANVIGCYSRNAILTNSSIYLDGREAGDLKYCGDINDGATTCCFKHQECLPNKLCHNPTTGNITREFCSDESWPEDRCSPVCPEWPAAGVFLNPCDETGTKFCCGTTKSCCGKNTYTEIDKDSGNIIAFGTSKIPTSSSATPVPSSSSAAEATATDASSANSSDNGTMGEKTKLGVGLGVGLGVPLVGAIATALFFWHRSLLARARAEANGGDGTSSPDQMAKVTSPGYENGYGYGHGQDAAAVTAPVAVAESAPGREVELGYTPAVYHQLEAERNMRNELGTSGQAHELL